MPSAPSSALLHWRAAGRRRGQGRMMEHQMSTPPSYHLSQFVSSRIADITKCVCNPGHVIRRAAGAPVRRPGCRLVAVVPALAPCSVLAASALPALAAPGAALLCPPAVSGFAPGLRAACGGRRPRRGPLGVAARFAPPASPRPPCAVRGPRWPSPVCTRPRPCEGGAFSMPLSALTSLPVAKSA